MKKLFIFVVVLLGLTAFASASNLDNAIVWMHSNGLTIYDNATDFHTNQGLRRDEAAKFFVQFSKIKGKTNYTKTAAECIFSDINKSRSDLKDIVVESCRLGLFQGDKGKFSPESQLTNVQAIAVLMRIIDGRQDEKSTKNRYDNYLNRASIWDIPNGTSPWSVDSNITRGNMAIMIYNGRLVDPTVSPLTTKEIGLLKEVYIDQNGNRKLVIDYIQLGGSNNCGGGVTCIINQNPLLRTFTVSNNVEIVMQTLSHTPDGNFSGNQSISFDDFKEKFNDTTTYTEYPNNYSQYLKAIPYWITIVNNVVTKIEEQYMS